MSRKLAPSEHVSSATLKKRMCLIFVGLPLFLPLNTRASQQMAGEVRGGGRKAIRKAAAGEVWCVCSAQSW